MHCNLELINFQYISTSRFTESKVSYDLRCDIGNYNTVQHKTTTQSNMMQPNVFIQSNTIQYYNIKHTFLWVYCHNKPRGMLVEH